MKVFTIYFVFVSFKHTYGKGTFVYVTYTYINVPLEEIFVTLRVAFSKKEKKMSIYYFGKVLSFAIFQHLKMAVIRYWK